MLVPYTSVFIDYFNKNTINYLEKVDKREKKHIKTKIYTLTAFGRKE